MWITSVWADGKFQVSRVFQEWLKHFRKFRIAVLPNENKFGHSETQNMIF